MSELDLPSPLIPAAGFALAEPSPAPGLLELLRLSPATRDHPDLAHELSRISTAELRELFPSDSDIRSVPCASGLRLWVDVADIFAAAIYVGWLQEAEDFRAFMMLARPGDTVVDIGANFGIYATHAAQVVGDKGRVLAFEPEAQVFKLLERNTNENGLAERLEIHRLAVAAVPGNAKFYVADNVSFSGLHDTGRFITRQVVDVEVVALDSFQTLSAPTIANLLKIDVEGAEHEVLAGAFQLLARSMGAIVLFEYSHKNLTPERHQALSRELRRLGADGFRVWARSAEGMPVRIHGLPDLSARVSANFFLAREGEPEERLVAALRATCRPAMSQDALGLALLRRISEQTKHLDNAAEIAAKARKILVAVGGEEQQLSRDTLEVLIAIQKAWLDMRAKRAAAEAEAAALRTSVIAKDITLAKLQTKLERVTEANKRLTDSVLAVRRRFRWAQWLLPALARHLP